jgi:hypothetical protein
VLIVDFGSDRDRAAGRGIADRWPGEPPDRNIDFDYGATATKQFQRHLPGGFGSKVRAAMDTRTIISSNKIFPIATGSVSLSHVICSLRCGGGSWTTPRRSSRPRQDSSISCGTTGERVSGVYRQQVTLASDPSGTIDDGLGVGRWRRKSDVRSAASSRQAAMSNGASAANGA